MTKFFATTLILVLISASLVYAQDNIFLGNGKKSDYINVDYGARPSEYNPFGGMAGFSAPSTPQTMALSPGIMVYQAKNLMDESISLRDENADILSKTQDMANQVQDTSSRIDTLAGQIQRDSAATAGYASRAEDYYRKVQSLNNETMDSVQMVSNLFLRNEELAAKIETQVNDSARYAASARDSLNETRSIYDKVNSTAVEIKAMMTGQDDFMEKSILSNEGSTTQ
ncbi:MAG: hypothetical protein ACE14P_01180 [Methanotrichaceae archaeon]